MLEIRVDLQTEYGILCRARSTAALRRKAKEGQHCFVTRDVERRDELEYLDRSWRTKARAEKEKGLVPLKVSALSQQDQDYYHEQKNYFQTIADAYTTWYDRRRRKSQKSNSTYYFCDPWEVDFELPSGAPENQLDGFLNET